LLENECVRKNVHESALEEKRSLVEKLKEALEQQEEKH
jgi:hypothetical protein